MGLRCQRCSNVRCQWEKIIARRPNPEPRILKLLKAIAQSNLLGKVARPLLPQPYDWYTCHERFSSSCNPAVRPPGALA